MANNKYSYSEQRNKKQPTQLQTKRWLVDENGLRIGPIETLPGGADQYRTAGTVVNCNAGDAVEYTYTTVTNETSYNAYLEFRPKDKCSDNPLYSTGFGMVPNSTNQVLPQNIVKQPYCLHFSTPGHRSRLVNEANQLIAATDGVTPADIPSHTPLTKYKVIVGIDIVSFKVTNSLPVPADVYLRDASTGTTIKQTPAGGIQAGGTYTFTNVDGLSMQLEFVVSGMVGRPKKAWLVNNNNLLLSSTDGSQPGRFPGFIPGNSPGGDIRLVEEGSITQNDLQVAPATFSRYKDGVQQVVIFLSSATLATIGPFNFRLQDVNTDQVIASANAQVYSLTDGFVLPLPSALSGPIRVRARALRGTNADTTDDWEAIDKVITLFPNEATFISKVGVKYEGVDSQGRQIAVLLVNTSYADTKQKWDGFNTFFVSMIPTSDYPGYTHMVRLFGETTRATFDSTQTFNIQPKTANQDILTVTYIRGTDTPGTTKVIFGSVDSTQSTTAQLTNVDGRFVTITEQETGGTTTSSPSSGLINQTYSSTLTEGWQTDKSVMNIGLKAVSNGEFTIQDNANPGGQSGYYWGYSINDSLKADDTFYANFDGLSWPVGFPLLIQKYLIPNGQIGRDARNNPSRAAESSIIVGL